jgi:hypothetical protein
VAFIFVKRLQRVIDKQIGKDQTAYIKSRFFVLMKDLEYFESNNDESIFLFLDFQKAFTSVIWNFSLLKQYRNSTLVHTF